MSVIDLMSDTGLTCIKQSMSRQPAQLEPSICYKKFNFITKSKSKCSDISQPHNITLDFHWDSKFMDAR